MCDALSARLEVVVFVSTQSVVENIDCAFNSDVALLLFVCFKLHIVYKLVAVNVVPSGDRL